MALLKIEADRLGPVVEVIECLQALESAYNHLYAFHLSVEKLKETSDADSVSSWRYAGPSRRKRSMKKIARPETVVLPEDRLHLSAVEVHSPGVWEFLGSLNPLETLRKYLQDRHERLKDHQYRSQLEAQRMMLENEKLKTEVVREQIELLARLGVPDENIRQVLTTHIVTPLERLDRQQDRGLIKGATLVANPPVEQNQSGE